MIILAVAAAAALAFANGANDNAKGVATLIGSRLMPLNKAIIFAAVMTFLSPIAAIVLAGELASRFGGKGIIDAAMVSNIAIALPISVGIGASLTVLLATVIGMPISTTHISCDSLFGIGMVTPGTYGDYQQGSGGLGHDSPGRGCPGGTYLVPVGRVAFARPVCPAMIDPYQAPLRNAPGPTPDQPRPATRRTRTEANRTSPQHE